jgi:hypothetical protein
LWADTKKNQKVLAVAVAAFAGGGVVNLEEAIASLG